MNKSCLSIFNIPAVRLQAIATTVIVALLLYGTMFLNTDVFVEDKIISKWYALIIGALGCLLVLVFQNNRKLSVDLFSFVLLLFVGYILLRGAFSNIITIKILLYLSFVFIYLFFKINNIPRQNVAVIIVLVCLAQAVYGILQYYVIVYTPNTFKVVGSFDNTAGFAASLAVGFPFCLLLKSSKILKYLGLLAAGIITAAVVLSDSRAGILSIILSLAIYLLSRSKNILRHKRRYSIIGIIAMLITGALLFFYKKNSTLGRVLIWKNSIEMISDKPVAGHGSGSFLSKYIIYQGNNFEYNPDSPFSKLADNVSHPFNEYLFLTVEYGIIGLLILTFALILIIRSTKRVSPEILSLLSVAVFSCFSYPFRYAFVIAIAAYCLSDIKAYKQINCNLKPNLNYALFVLCILCCMLLVKDIHFENQWNKLAKRPFHIADYTLIDKMRALYDKWNGNPYFLYNYGTLLNSLKRYDESNAVFTECTLYLNDYDVQMIIGDNYMKTERWDDAESHYILASNMIPCRFRPLDRLMELYKKTGIRQKALEVAEVISAKDIKVHSPAITNIIRKANALILDANSE